MSRLLCVIAICLAPQLASGQTQDRALPPAAKAVLDAFEQPLHPILGSVAPGGGIAVGIGYDTPRSRDWFHNVSGMVTLSRYWALEAETGRQTQKSRFGAFGSIRNMNELDFFGIGPDSARENRSNYRLRETAFGARGWLRPRTDIRLGGVAQVYSPDLGRGSDAERSIEHVFQPADVPGFAANPLFTRYRGFIEWTHPELADPSGPKKPYGGQQGTYQLAVEATRDHDGGQYSFYRMEAELQERFAGLKPGQRLTLHGLLGVTNRNAIVPYYLQYTLGGGSLGPFRPDTLGTDGTKTTLRGYQSYRFRDRDLLLMQAEYRIPLHKVVDATVFYDAGQVASHASALFRDLKQGTGFSLSYMRNGASMARMDVGYGSEGAHIFWGFGRFGL